MLQWIHSACSGATGRGRGRGGATGGGAFSFHGRNYRVPETSILDSDHHVFGLTHSSRYMIF